MKIITIVGARPQFIKAAPVSQALAFNNQEIIVHTGQHYDVKMSDVFFRQLGIPAPKYNLGIGSSSHGAQTGAMLAQIEEVIKLEQPELVVVYGDTNSTLAGALAAAKLHFPVAHIEAGIRSFNRTMPEELNRVLTDHLADLLFCPTERALVNLKREGITKGVFNSGDVMYDALLHFLKQAKHDVIEKLGISPGDFYLATIHRSQNTDQRENLAEIISAFNQLEKPLIFPLHPRTKSYLQKYQLMDSLKSHIKLIEPVGYLEMLALMQKAALIFTDSGGIQKEAYLLEVPCVTLRRDTEWPETVAAAWNTLVGTNRAEIIQAAKQIKPMGKGPKIFGDGQAALKIARFLENL